MVIDMHKIWRKDEMWFGLGVGMAGTTTLVKWLRTFHEYFMNSPWIWRCTVHEMQVLCMYYPFLLSIHFKSFNYIISTYIIILKNINMNNNKLFKVSIRVINERNTTQHTCSYIIINMFMHCLLIYKKIMNLVTWDSWTVYESHILCIFMCINCWWTVHGNFTRD